MENDAADVVRLSKFDEGMLALARADHDHDDEKAEAAIAAIAVEWIKMDADAQARRLHYFRGDYGATLRAALAVAAQKYDLGMVASNYAEMKGRPWP